MSFGMTIPKGAINPNKPKVAARCIPSFKKLGFRDSAETIKRGIAKKAGMNAVRLDLPPMKYPAIPKPTKSNPVNIPTLGIVFIGERVHQI